MYNTAADSCGNAGPAATAAQQQTYSAPAATRAASSTADIDTTVNVHVSELACISVQELLGTDYLYPDQKFKLEAASPGANTINVNLLFVDENNQLEAPGGRAEVGWGPEDLGL